MEGLRRVLLYASHGNGVGPAASIGVVDLVTTRAKGQVFITLNRRVRAVNVLVVECARSWPQVEMLNYVMKMDLSALLLSHLDRFVETIVVHERLLQD